MIASKRPIHNCWMSISGSSQSSSIRSKSQPPPRQESSTAHGRRPIFSFQKGEWYNEFARKLRIMRGEELPGDRDVEGELDI